MTVGFGPPRLPQILLPTIAACELALSDKDHVLQILPKWMPAPAGASDSTLLKVAASTALSLGHFGAPSIVQYRHVHTSIATKKTARSGW